MVPLVIGLLVGSVGFISMSMGVATRPSRLDPNPDKPAYLYYAHPWGMVISTSILWGTVAYALASAVDLFAFGGGFKVVPLIVGLALWAGINLMSNRAR